MADKVALKIKHSTMKSFCHLTLPVTAMMMLLVSTNDHHSWMAAASGVVSPLNINRSNNEVISIAVSDLESEFMMDSEITRMLAGSAPGNGPHGYDAIKGKGPPFNCVRANHYCVPPKNPPSAKEKCDPYKRNCGRH